MSSPLPHHPDATWTPEVLALYLRLLSASFLQHVQEQAGIRQHNRVYTFRVVMWLLIVQRLHGGASLETAVLELLRGLPALGTRAFFVDGTTVRLAHSPALCERCPRGSNQHGEGHWPLVRMLVAHDLETGLALRPEWGPMHGPQAVSEQQLLEAALDR